MRHMAVPLQPVAALSRSGLTPVVSAYREYRPAPAVTRMVACTWHGYAQLLLSGRWISVSPTFDTLTCQRAGVPPLEFDGVHDALLQSFDGGAATMGYIKRHGLFHDVPARFLAAEMPRLYPFARDHGITRFQAAGRAGSVTDVARPGWVPDTRARQA